MGGGEGFRTVAYFVDWVFIPDMYYSLYELG